MHIYLQTQVICFLTLKTTRGTITKICVVFSFPIDRFYHLLFRHNRPIPHKQNKLSIAGAYKYYGVHDVCTFKNALCFIENIFTSLWKIHWSINDFFLLLFLFPSSFFISNLPSLFSFKALSARAELKGLHLQTVHE